ncbi:MAG: TlpA family protein disulfide reductase [Rhodanobacter sp.]
MTKGRLILVVITAALLALLAGIYAGTRLAKPAQPEKNQSLTKERIEKLFTSTLSDAQGKAYSFAQWRGKTLIVNFWATWCPPCREEMPAFSRLQAKYAANGVQFVGIALDEADNVQAFSTQYPVTYPLLVGGTDGATLAQMLGNTRLALPYTLIVSPAGEASFTQLGGVSERELDSLLQRSTLR